eukprot:scaffold1131_cov278-Chaetoceros_neogracile.AAC.2
MLSQLRSKPDALICSLFVVVSQTEDQQSDIEDLNKVSSRMDSMVLLSLANAKGHEWHSPSLLLTKKKRY